MWFEVEKITFTNLEVSYMYKPEIPKTLFKLFRIVDAVKNNSGKSFKITNSNNSEEYGVYFKDNESNNILYFGVWHDFWNEYGYPLCYGVDSNKWSKAFVDRFKSSHEKYFEKNGYILCAINEDTLSKETCSEDIAKIIYDELVMLTS